MNTCHRYLCLLLCLFCAGRLYAADSMQYQHYTIDNGLPSNNVYSCIQDRNGYMWFTTDKGAVKYNGYTFEVFNTIHGGLPSDDVYRLEEDRMGRIWVYCISNRIGYLKNSKYTEIQLPPSPYEYKKEFGRAAIYDSVVAIDVPTDKYSTILFSGPAGNYFLQTSHIRAFYAPPYLYAVIYQDTGRASAYRVYNLLQSPLTYKTYPIFFDDRKLLDGGSEPFARNKYLYRYGKGDDIICRADLQNRNVLCTSLKSFGKNDSVSYTMGFAQGSLFVLTRRYLYLLDLETLRLKEAPVLLSDYFPGSQLSFLFDNRQGMRWYMSTADGILQSIPGLAPHIFNIKKNSSDVRLAGCSGNTSFWFDLMNSQLYYVDSNLNYTNQATTFSRIRYVQQVNSNLLITATDKQLFQSGLDGASYQPVFDSVKTLGINFRGNIRYTQDSFVNGNSNLSLAQGGCKAFKYINRDKVVICNTTGLFIISHSHDTLFYNQKQSIQYMFTTRKDFLQHFLFYNSDCITAFNPVNDSCTTFYFKNTGMGALARVSQVCVDGYNNLYFLNNKNLLRLNPFRMQWKVLAQHFNLENARMDIARNKILLAGGFGIAAAQICSQDSIGNFFLMPNVKNRWYRQVNNMWLADNGHALLQTDKRWLTADGDSLLARGIRSDQDSVTAFHLILKRPSEKPVHNGDTILLEQEKPGLLLDAINFYGSGTINYKYLLPAEKNYWQQALAGEITFAAAVKPGEYYPLYIQISDDMWKSDRMLVYLYIPPYWYQTHNARVFFLVVGSVILILAIIGGISLTRQAVIRAQAKRRALTELELRAVYSQINPHFIFNTLSTALYFIDRKDYDNAYKHVNKFSHLLRSYLKSSHDRYVLLSEEIDMLRRYIELQQTRFERLFTYEIKVENRVPAEHIQIPSLLLQPLVENAINHGLFHRKEPGGRLLITFAQGNSSDELICIIEDNGIGRMRAMDLKKQNDAERQSYGSKLTDKLVDIFRQYEAMNIHIEYIDKTIPETGTIVRLTIGNVKYVV